MTHTRRPDRWWMRWYLIASDPGIPGLQDPGEYVECGTLTRYGANRVINHDARVTRLNHVNPQTTGYPLRPVRRKVWLREN